MDPGAVGGGALHGKTTQLIHAGNLRHNMGVLGFYRTFMSMIVGLAMGILGVEGWWGFLLHLGSQLLCAPLMTFKGASPPTKFFHAWPNFLFYNVFSSVTLLTYILFWMIAYNLSHIF